METKLAPGYMSRVKHVERISRMRDAAEEMYELLDGLAEDAPVDDYIFRNRAERIANTWRELRERINA